MADEEDSEVQLWDDWGASKALTHLDPEAGTGRMIGQHLPAELAEHTDEIKTRIALAGLTDEVIEGLVDHTNRIFDGWPQYQREEVFEAFEELKPTTQNKIYSAMRRFPHVFDPHEILAQAERTFTLDEVIEANRIAKGLDRDILRRLIGEDD